MRVASTLSGLLAIAAALSALASGAAAEERWLDYEPAVVSMTGRLALREFPGPPNHGESPDDAREVARLLLLDAPVSVRADPRSDLNDLEQRRLLVVQLVSSEPLRLLEGVHIRGCGTLFAAHTGHHHAELLMTVASIEAIE
jgi:hypothetical protein